MAQLRGSHSHICGGATDGFVECLWLTKGSVDLLGKEVNANSTNGNQVELH
jgi:hypothetical protein